MNNFEELVKLITEKVIRKIEEASEKSLAVNTESTHSCQPTTLVDKNSEVLSKDETLILNQLSLETLSRVAQMMPSTTEESQIIDRLLSKKSVTVLKSGREYASRLATCSYAMKRDIIGYEQKWQSFGATFVEENELKKKEPGKELLSVNKLKKLVRSGCKEIEILPSTIVTPLAKDFIREHQLNLIILRKEE
ncbi:MAG: hypothetical protein ACTJHC_05785 [Vagococcus sp.]